MSSGLRASRAARVPRVKVCGLTRPGDIELAARVGADAFGVVEYPRSPRAVDAERAADLIAKLGQRGMAVAVMVDAEPRAASAWLERSGAHALQLCGAESPRDWSDFSWPLLRRVAVGPGAAEEIEVWRDVALAFVLDHPSAPGGSGRDVDLTLAAELSLAAPCLLAGGLDGDNVAARVARVRPAGVDASSRLESAPGRKDAARVERFVGAARRALEGL